MGGKYGYSLIEAMIVLALLSMICIAVPGFYAWFNRQGVSLAVDQLRADLQLARVAAIEQKQTCSILLNDPGLDQYTNSTTHQRIDLTRYRGGVRFLPKGPDGGNLADRVNFSSRGMCFPAANIYLADRQMLTIYKIHIPAPGGISVLRWNGHGWR